MTDTDPTVPEFDADAYKAQARAAAVQRVWHAAMAAESEARTAEAQGVFDVPQVNEQGEKVGQVTVVAEGEGVERLVVERQARAADLRERADAALKASGQDEVALIGGRLAELQTLLPAWSADLAQWEDYRDEPDVYGGLKNDGSPIDHDEATATATVLSARIADARAELAYFAAAAAG